MNRLRRVIEHAFHVQFKTLTDAQEAGTACIHCGTDLPDPDQRTEWRCLGLPWRHRHNACQHACTLVTVEDTETLFRAAIPARQHVWLWHLGIDDVADMGQRKIAALDAEPHQTVTITHPRGTLTTRPLPLTYAEQITDQARRLGYTAHTTAHQGSVTR